MPSRGWLLFFAILALASLLRLIFLDRVPPGMWYDEALYALDGYEISTGHFRLFYDSGNHPREPLYPYCLGAAFSLFGATTLVARFVSAAWGIAAVAMLFPVAARLVGWRWGLAAMAFFAAFRWPIHFSRTIFRAVTPTFFLLAVIWLFLRWRETRKVRYAALCGAALGAGMYSYLSFRLVTPLVILWILWLAVRKQLSIRQEMRSLFAMAGSALLVFAPLGIDYIVHPEHFTGRMDQVSMFETTEKRALPDGTTADVRVRKPASVILADIGANLGKVCLMWTWEGDHVPRHNLPHKPIFDWLTGSLFFLGLLWCLFRMFRDFTAFLVITWLLVILQASVFSFGAPNILRVQAAAPAAILCVILGLRLAHGLLLKRIGSSIAPALLVGATFVLFASTQLYDYFVRFARSVEARNAFNTDMFYLPAADIRSTAGAADVYVPEELAGHTVFRFVTAGMGNIRPYGPKDDLVTSASRPSLILMTMRSRQLAHEAGNAERQDFSRVPGSGPLKQYRIPVITPDGEHDWRDWAVLWRTGANKLPDATWRM